jgi:hypothetical protein
LLANLFTLEIGRRRAHVEIGDLGGPVSVFSIFSETQGAIPMKSGLRLAAVPVVIVVLTLMLVITPAPTTAQVANGSISGNVVDAQGAAIADAAVKAISKDTNKEATTTTDSAGLFRLSLLPPGSYKVEITRTGFHKVVFDNFEVSVGADRGLGTVKLEIGEVSATVEVTAAPSLIENTEAQITNAFTATDIAQFAGVLENQGLDNLALTVPGVASVRDSSFSNTNGGVGFTVNGLRGRNNDQQIDGQNNNDNSVAGPAVFLSDPEFVQEYQITTNNFSAEYGRNSGSVVNIITKSGTNDFHGSVYGTESNSALNALSNTQKGFEGLKKPARFNDEFTGGTIGGPVWKDHLFFFGGLDDEIVSQQQVYATGLLTPTPAGVATLAACFPNSTSVAALQKYGPYAISAGNPTPQGTPTFQTLSNCADGVTRSLELNGIQRQLPTGSRAYNFPIKLDLQTAKNHFYGRYLYNKSTFFNLDSPPNGQAAAGYSYNNPGLGQDYGFSWVRTISARMSNELRASYGRVNFTFGGNASGNTIPPAGQIDQALANITFSGSGLLQFGPLTNLPQGRIVNSYQGQDNWSYFLGRHSLKAGVNFTYQRSPNIFLPNLNGQFRFANWGSFGANTPNRIRIASGNPDLDFREKDTFAYFGDDFKVKNNLTLNLGVTWSYYGQPANLFHTNSVKQQTGSSPLWNPALPLSVTTFPSIPAPKNSWAPGVGFAWTPGIGGRLVGNGKTVIRGGYRLAYDPPFYNIYLNISSAAPNVLLNTLTGANARANPLLAVPTGPNVRAQLKPVLTAGVFDPRTFSETSITPDFGPQRTHEWSLGVQREVAAGAVFEVRYVGNHGTNLFQTTNANPEIAGLAAQYPNLVPSGLTPCPASQAVVPQAVGRVNCNLGVVRARTNTGYSDYNSVQTELRANQLWHQLTVKGGYTFSKTTDNVTEIFSTGGAGNTNAFAQSQVNFTGQEHGTSGLNYPHNFYVVFTESLPFFRSQHGFLGHALGGWVVSANYFITSGQPYTPSQAGLSYLSGSGAFQGQTTSPYDTPFNGAFVGADGALRPFLGSLAAPVNTVGIYAGDACNYFGVTGTEPICTINPASLVSLNGLNQAANISTYQPTVVSNKQVRFIANTAQSDAVFGTPFGNVGRNTLSDYWTNIGNFGVFKTVKLTERLQVQWHMTMLNVFNHPNFSTIDPYIDDAGLATEGTGFADPRVQTGGLQGTVGNPGRSVRFGLKISF